MGAMSADEIFTAALILLARADGRVTPEEAEAVWAYASARGLGPPDLVRLGALDEQAVLSAIAAGEPSDVEGFMGVAWSLCLADDELHPAELRLVGRIGALAGVAALAEE